MTASPEPMRSRDGWESIKARHRLAEVARRSGLDNIPASGRVMVCCPTPGHADSTPSMQLDLDRDRYWCFGCGCHGDVIDWVRGIEGVDTATAIEILDRRQPLNAVLTTPSGRRITKARKLETPQLDRTPASRVADANQLAWRYYSSPAFHQRAVAYLAERSIDAAALETELSAPVVGHTPSSKTRIDGLTTFLARKGFTEDEAIDAGLATRLPDGCVIDFHRDRAILPVKGPAGAVIALLGRDTPGRSQHNYLNPPHTASYHKNQVLYRPSTPRLDAQASTIVCEGPLDALGIAAQAAAAGLSRYYSPVAACGRVLSDTQIDLILANHPRAPVLAGDGDQPGRQANLDWAGRILAKGRESVITTWPEGQDPASWLAARGPDGLRAVTRFGCLDDHSGVLRPRHCGAVLTEAAFPDHDPHHLPDPKALARAVREATTNLSPAAKQRYLTAAASVFGLQPPAPIRARASPHPVDIHIRPESARLERIHI